MAGSSRYTWMFYVKHLPPKVVDGVTRHSVNRPRCYRRKKFKDVHSYYYVPPTRCRFYDRDVWCPRDILGYLTNYYGEDVLSQAQTHASFYDKRRGIWW